MADEPKKPTPAPQPRTPNIKFAVEIADRKNRSVKWPLDERILRGRWEKANLPNGTTVNESFNMPDLPGLVLKIDTAAKEASIYDPLAMPQQAKLLERAKKANLAAFGADASPEEPVKYVHMTDHEMKSFVYYVRRLIDTEQCRVLAGTVPLMTEIDQMPGLVSMHNFDAGQNVERLKPVQKNYVAPRKEVVPAIEGDIIDEQEFLD